MEIIDDITGYLGIILVVINSILYVIKSYRNHKNSMALTYFTLYLVTTCIIQLIVLVLARKEIDNLYLSHYYFISQLIFLTLFYMQLFNNNQKKIAVIVLVLVLITLSIQYSLKPKLFSGFNIFEVFITSLPLVIYSIIHLYNSLSQKGQFMYINAAVLMYITTSTLIFILGDYLSVFKDNESIKNIWSVNKFLYVGYLLLILLEWKKLKSQVKSKL